MTFAEYRAAVVESVVALYGKEPWFSGVCCDNVKMMYETNAPLYKAMEQAQCDTLCWDGPWSNEE